jgi:hypothetical protein
LLDGLNEAFAIAETAVAPDVSVTESPQTKRIGGSLGRGGGWNNEPAGE